MRKLWQVVSSSCATSGFTKSYTLILRHTTTTFFSCVATIPIFLSSSSSSSTQPQPRARHRHLTLSILVLVLGLVLLVLLFYHHPLPSSSPHHHLLFHNNNNNNNNNNKNKNKNAYHHPHSDPCSPSGIYRRPSFRSSYSSIFINHLKECEDGRVRRLLKKWDDFLRSDGKTAAVNWKPPYWENCSEKTEEYRALDRRGADGSKPKWSLWKGNVRYPLPDFKEDPAPEPPWVEGADADNYPLTRRVQEDLWLHQHPANCSDDKLRFLWVAWENGSGFGLGARIKCVLAFFAIAFRENRILVTDSFGRANHNGCQGKARNQWECYFLPETTEECRKRAMELRELPEAWAKGIITDNRNYSWGDMWNGAISRRWGTPWEYIQPTAEVHGELMRHPASDRRWWRAQAIRYMMRFPSEYTCSLMNQARHQYFGAIAARNMLSSLPTTWPIEAMPNYMTGDMEKIIWSSKRPWIPRPMISMHVRLGDKAKEMELVPYEKYMELASRLRISFPDATNIWLATEMEDVIAESINYTNWNIYYTNITRQKGETSMFDYETSIGTEASTNNGFVNFLMALESDFFIGPLGSTWSLLLDCMRATGGKLMSGFLSVNKDTFW